MQAEGSTFHLHHTGLLRTSVVWRANMMAGERTAGKSAQSQPRTGAVPMVSATRVSVGSSPLFGDPHHSALPYQLPDFQPHPLL